jgi:hypothetical protein
MMNRLRIFIGVGWVVFACANLSYGYVIDGPEILQLVAQRIGRADTLLVKQHLVTYILEQKMRRESAEETVHYVFPNAFRIDLTSDGTRSFFLARDGRNLAVVNDKIDSSAESELDLYHFLLLHHHSSGLINFLEAFGIDTTVRSLGKFQRKVAYVIGAQYPDEDHSQLWIDKETLLPMRWLLVALTQPNPADSKATNKALDSDQAGEASDLDPTTPVPGLERLEFRLSLWQKFGRLYYPMRMDIFQNGVLTREIRVADVNVDPQFKKAIRDIDQQRERYPKVQKKWVEPEEEENLDDIQKTIDDFKKKFE